MTVRVSRGQTVAPVANTPTVSRRLVHLRSSADGTQLRTGTMHGITYIVVPTVSKLGNNVEFPVNAPTPELIPSHVLAFLTESRNNRPVVMGHPQVNGEYVSANTPDILDTYAYGYMYGAQFIDGEVRCDMWLDPIRAAKVDGAVRVIERLQNGEMVEVSEGDFVIVREESGEHDGRSYGGVWEFCASDHLATLREDEVGACSVADGCGALRSSVLRVARMLDDDRDNGGGSRVTALPTIRTSILSQARRPTFTGTETGTWSKPTFADYIRYLFNGDTSPTSVSQCSAELKRSITSHTLLGDPDASNFSDLSFFPVVNPSTGKLNENALRAVISGRGSASDITESVLTSAQDMARRLLNSEFSANLETSASHTSEADDMKTKKESNVIKRLFASMANALRTSMSNNELRQKLYKALSDVVRGLSYVYDEDVETKVVRYCVVVRYGDYCYSDYYDVDYLFFQRTFTLDANSNVTVNDDSVQIELYDDGWRPVVKMAASPDDVQVIVSESEPVTEPNNLPCACKGESTMDITARTSIIKRLCSLPIGLFKGGEKSLEAMSDAALTSLDEKYPDGTAAPSQTTTAAAPPAPALGTVIDPDGGQPATPAPVADTVSIPKEDYEVMKASAAAFQRSQEERKTRLVTALKTAQTEYKEDELKAMSVQEVERLAKALKVDVSGGSGGDTSDTRFDYSGARPAVSGGVRRRAPDTYGLRAAEEAKKAKTAAN